MRGLEHMARDRNVAIANFDLVKRNTVVSGRARKY